MEVVCIDEDCALAALASAAEQLDGPILGGPGLRKLGRPGGQGLRNITGLRG